jgi:cytochrome c-type biogenesis protein CcmH
MSSDADFLAVARGRLQQLQSMREANRLDAKTYDAERRAIEREIGAHLLAQAPAAPRPRPSRRLVAGLSVAVAVVAVAGYMATGSPALVAGGSGAVPADHLAGGSPEAAGNEPASPAAQQQVAAMVEKLAARMKERPDDVEGWIMLARSYTVLGRFADAVPAYRRAVELQPRNASLLADYADTVAATKRTADNPESIALIERALAIDPGHPKALALAGTVDYDRGDYARAIDRWQLILERVSPESELGQQITGSIADARARLGGAAPPAAASTAGAGATQSATAGASAGAGSTQAATGLAAPAVSGMVTLDPALAAKAAPGDTVFVFARAASGGKMPLAVQRAKVADLPLRFKLDDSMAMAPGMTVSSAKQVIVVARISKSGQATPSPGDLAGEAAPVAPGAANVAVRIDRVVATP